MRDYLPIHYRVTNPDVPNRATRRHMHRRKRCDGNGERTEGRK